MPWNKDGTVFIKTRLNMPKFIKELTEQAQKEADEEYRLKQEEERLKQEKTTPKK